MNRTGRYAPSPTGRLHLGNLRTALIAWLAARSQQADFLIRIEDLDRERSRPEHAAGQIEDLLALGLDWDGELPAQSERAEAYDAAVEQLKDRGLVYECFCTRTEIRAAASAPHGTLPEGAYPGTCRELSERERNERRKDRKPALRVRAQGETIEFEDRVAGTCRGGVDDFVIRRRDGVHGYNLAVALDDAEQGIGEVVRGRDLLDSTPRQIWIQRELALEPVGSWAHVPLVVGADGRRLAKRDGDVTLPDRLERGESAGEVLALLASSLGLCSKDDRPDPAELIGRFSYESLPPGDWRLQIPGAGA